MHRSGADHPPGYWHHLWPTPDEVVRVMRDSTRTAKVPKSLEGLYAPDARDMDELAKDPRWCVWIFNPHLDFLIKPAKINPRHWANMCLTPLHAPCLRAIRSMGPAVLHRIAHGELAPSPRKRFIGFRTYER